ncbi:ABC transporter permease [Phenylobacterium sp.]|jgi:peptide/nickel transport system permease protein|uniref:ABC transporter permease n=1 Tax=Phenylobacterium sp. TaxID=1871053 RepID=UPI002F41986B
MRKLSFSAVLGAALVGLLLLTVLVSFVWTPVDPLAIDLSATLAPPSARRWLGSDEFGRDVLSRVMAGARISVGIALATVACAVTAGAIVGVAAGFLRGPVDRTLMTFNDAMLAFPGMLLALGVIAVFGAGVGSIIAALASAYLPSVVRVVRASVLSIREREYVEASRVMGNSEVYSMIRHVVPNASPQIAVLATSMFGWVLLSESALSFLGVGVPAPAPTWGNMLASARPYLDTAAWLGVAPGLCIAATLLGANLLSDALRERFDPRHL